ncbi:hypothetical protein AYO20_10032 [Fonsecaea nubica]|uniref:Xylanolytic transcriptional activator regulatory domain-containing protein n=1 Tax=Fonsecaea nubica TaxID=856822 RepID=A0A178C9F8_9EURO|nr:hypothetical protein AYO20_10032 [Fonsecaea nubica]OAL26608.1 hypothetical protein AYO20_10032 [Fonsecaea nubica]
MASISATSVPPSGIWCPAVTFFNPVTEDLDLEAQSKYYKYLSTTGLAGLVILGTNAEAFLLTREERFQLIQTARAATGPNFPIMAGVGSHSTRQVLQLIDDAAQAGANYALLLPAAYFGKATTPAVIVDFYDQVARGSLLPIVMYNFPGVCNGVDLDSELITQIVKRNPGKIVGVKLTCGSVAKIVRLVASLPSCDFATFGGQSDFLLGGLAVGSSGCIAAFANVFPKTICRIHQLYSHGRIREALKLHQRAALAESPIKSGIAATKYAVATYSAPAAGITDCEGKLLPRRPYQKPSEDVKAGISQLEEENARLKAAVRRHAAAGDTTSNNVPPSKPIAPTQNHDHEQQHELESPSNADVVISNPLVEDRAWFVHDSTSSQAAYVGEASCTAFGTRLYQYLDRNTSPSPIPRARLVGDEVLSQNIFTEYALPPRAHAVFLIRVAIRLVGLDYHLMMRKQILEQLNQLYVGRLTIEQDPLLACRIFTIFALGELYTNKAKESQKVQGAPNVPGLWFFVRAMSLFQEIREEATVSYIEALLLISIYSLALNRANSAYVYAGTALRLSLTLGLHHNVPPNQMFSPIERERRIRVWWTVYIFDRNWSSKLGHPIMIRDDDIDVAMPSMKGLSAAEMAEFSEPEHLIANVHLARITGDIMNHIYNKNCRRQVFVQSVQKILRRLRSWAETLPEVIRLQQDPTRRYTARHVASLHLCFNQLHSSFEGLNGEPPPPPISTITTALAEACVHAARSSNQILDQLWVDGSLATFGFFDAQYLFSSTLVLLIETLLRPDTSDSEAVSTAIYLLKTISEEGNLPAYRYYGHLMQLQTIITAFQTKSLRQSGEGLDLMQDGGGLETDVAVESLPTALPAPLGDGLCQDANATSNALITGSALDDPFLQNFLAYSDLQWPATIEGLGAIGSSAISPPQWVLEWDTQNQDLYGNEPLTRDD